MRILYSTLIFCFSIFVSNAQHKQAYQIYNSDGKKVSYKKFIKELKKNELVFFGELHNNSISHWLQTEVCKSLHDEFKEKLVVGAEMFESDDQLIIDEYLARMYPAKKFEKEVKLWDNYKTDYKPVLEFARDSQLAFIATNIPRRYAAMVARAGFEALNKLSETGKSYVAPLPIAYDENLPGYKRMSQMMMGHGKGNPNLPKAQASKDATMAWFIQENMKENGCFLHLNGRYHSDNKEGIIWYLNKYKPGVKLVSITTALSEDVDEIPEGEAQQADFIIVVDEDMTSTY